MPILQLKNISKHFGGVQALTNISFAVDEGTVTGLIGPNGAGKTTAFNLMTGFGAPDSGEIYLGDRLLNGLPPHDICQLGVSRTFQIVKPFSHMTVLQNVMVGAFVRTDSYREARQRAHLFIDLVGLAAKADVHAATLNVAERRRLELGRALATEPRILLLDEMMSGLNATEIALSLDFLRRLKKRGKTIIFIEHLMDAVVTISDRIVVLDHGVKIADGTPEQVINHDRVIEAYLGHAASA